MAEHIDSIDELKRALSIEDLRNMSSEKVLELVKLIQNGQVGEIVLPTSLLLRQTLWRKCLKQWPILSNRPYLAINTAQIGFMTVLIRRKAYLRKSLTTLIHQKKVAEMPSIG